LSDEAVLFQRAGQVTVGGIECDVNDVWHHYWGQKPVSEVAPQPQSQPESSGPIVVRYDADFTADMPGVGYRSIDSIQSICVHTVECPPERDGIAVAQWQTNPANGSSYNVLAGADGKRLYALPVGEETPLPLETHLRHDIRSTLAEQPKRQKSGSWNDNPFRLKDYPEAKALLKRRK